MTQDTLTEEFDRELDRRIQIIATQEADSPTHRKMTGLQFTIFAGITLAICLLGAGVAAL